MTFKRLVKYASSSGGVSLTSILSAIDGKASFNFLKLNLAIPSKNFLIISISKPTKNYPSMCERLIYTYLPPLSNGVCPPTLVEIRIELGCVLQICVQLL